MEASTAEFQFVVRVTIAGIGGGLLSWIFIHRWLERNRKGPRTWPVIGATIEQLWNYHRMHDWLADYLSKSRTMNVPLPFITYTYTADPANVEYILKTNFNNYPKGEEHYTRMEALLGDGIFNSDGEMWRKQRKVSSFEFASKNLRDFSTVVFREYGVKLSTIITQAATQNKQVDMQDLFMRLTLDSICKVGFGVEIGTLAPELPENAFAKAFDTANGIVTFRFFDAVWRIKRFFQLGSEAVLTKSIEIIDNFTYEVIRKRRAEINNSRGTIERKDNKQMKHDILSRFIELSEDPENKLCEKNLRDIVLNFVIAGRDTTATTLSWFIYMLTKHPDIGEKVYMELKDFEEQRASEEQVVLNQFTPDDITAFKTRVSQFAGIITYDSLGKLTYLHASITETLRLYPAVPQDPKGVMEDDFLPDGSEVKAGGMITYVPYSMGRMEYNWGSDAAAFNPDRWFKDGTFQTASPFKFTAFQAGPRICLGKDSAYLQMKMTLAILCRFFTFKLALPESHVKYRMMAVLSMKNGLKLTISRRTS